MSPTIHTDNLATFTPPTHSHLFLAAILVVVEPALVGQDVEWRMGIGEVGCKVGGEGGCGDGEGAVD